jgi:5-methylcytosine-specific restriction endonuclease McrA
MVAASVRYERRARTDGRISCPDVQEEIEMKRARVAGGKAYTRRLPAGVREAVFRAKGRICAVCGAAAVDIDHIDGRGSDEIDNLQPLCKRCHREKSRKSLAFAVETEPEYELISKRLDEYETRVRANPPLRRCDDENSWPVMYRPLAGLRRALSYSPEAAKARAKARARRYRARRKIVEKQVEQEITDVLARSGF